MGAGGRGPRAEGGRRLRRGVMECWSGGVLGGKEEGMGMGKSRGGSCEKLAKLSVVADNPSMSVLEEAIEKLKV